MFYFHNNLKSHKVFNASLQSKYFTLPKQSGVLATEEDVTSNTLVSMIQKPTITFPENDSIDYNNVINYTPYTKNPLYLGSKTHTSFEAAFDIGFTNIFRSEKIEDTYELNTTMSLPLDISKTTLYIRIKFHSGLYSSPWSDPIKVTTKEFKINVPTIITPTNNASGISKNIVISTSAFSYVGVADTHESTTYQIADDVNFNSIVFNSTSITALTSIIATMQEGKTYFLRVRHNGTKYGSSNWSTTVKISTIVPYTPLASVTGKSISQANGNYSARAGFTIYNNVLYVPRWVRDTGLYVSHGIFPQRWQGDWSARIFDDIPAGSYLYFVPVSTGRIGSITISWNTKYYDFTNLAVHVVRNGGCGWSASFIMYLYSKEDVLLDYYNVSVSAWC